jgi:hypothetical protein
MSVLGKIAFYQNRHDEVPNQQLAKELAETEHKRNRRQPTAQEQERPKRLPQSKFFLLAPQFEQNVAVCSISPPQYWHVESFIFPTKR